jgi:RNA polymerase sigma-70 factor (ECF subfamily)
MRRTLAWRSRAGYATAGMLLPFLLAILSRATAAADESLFRRVAARDAQALRTLYDRCVGVALGLALRIVRNRSEAEDVVQEAFLEAWKRAQTFDPGRGSATAFVLSIVRSRALDRVRSRSSADKAMSSLGREASAPVPLPIEAAEQRQDRDRIQAALATLPPEQRQVLELAYFEGLTQREIADRLSDPLGTVKTRARLALEKLAALLGDAR